MRAAAAILAATVLLVPLACGPAKAQGDDLVTTGRAAVEDPAEAATYRAASSLSDPAARAAALTAFAIQYPHGANRLEALRQAMAAYQALNDKANLESSARRVLEVEPADVRALALVVFLERTRAQDMKEGPARGGAAKQAADDANRGLRALDVFVGDPGMSPEAVAAVRDKLSAVFFGALGFDRLVAGDYAVARYYYLKAVHADPSDAQTDYQFAIVSLRAKPLDPEGFWWAARAYALAGQANAAASQAAIDALGRASYARWHGTEDGWAELLVEASGETTPPPGFTVRAAMTPAEEAVQAVRDNDPAELTVPDWEFVLSMREASAANLQAADKVWAAIQAKQAAGPLKLPLKVLSVGKDFIDGAVTDENRAAGHTDLHVILAAPPPHPVAPGDLIQVVGPLARYTPSPFLFTMQKGEIAP